MDKSHAAMVLMNWDADGFDEYECGASMVLGVNLFEIAQILKCANNDDTLVIGSSRTSDYITLKLISTKVIYSHYPIFLK